MIKISSENLEALKVFGDVLKKDESTMINEALECYFKEETQRLEQEQNSQTNLSYDEFWDDVEL